MLEPGGEPRAVVLNTAIEMTVGKLFNLNSKITIFLP